MSSSACDSCCVRHNAAILTTRSSSSSSSTLSSSDDSSHASHCSYSYCYASSSCCCHSVYGCRYSSLRGGTYGLVRAPHFWKLPSTSAIPGTGQTPGLLQSCRCNSPAAHVVPTDMLMIRPCAMFVLMCWGVHDYMWLLRKMACVYVWWLPETQAMAGVSQH